MTAPAPLRAYELDFLRQGNVLVRDTGCGLMLMWLTSEPAIRQPER